VRNLVSYVDVRQTFINHLQFLVLQIQVGVKHSAYAEEMRGYVCEFFREISNLKHQGKGGILIQFISLEHVVTCYTWTMCSEFSS
jgi:hypothetical protein